MIAPAISYDFRQRYMSPADVHVVTVGGHSIPAHSSVLASASPVLESMISHQKIKILGAPHNAVLEFLGLLNAGEGGRPLPEETAAMKLYGVQLLVLSHSYRIGWLKRRCEAAVGKQVESDDAVDVMKLAQLCDAPKLRQRCLAVAAKDFAALQRTEGWRFVQKHDPRLELEILQFMEEGEQRRKRWRRERVDQEVFLQLSQAMQCLEHICTEGCTVVGPHDGKPPRRSRGPCTSFGMCESLQFLIKHFAKCGKKLAGGGGCIQCKRMWQLFRLHSSICDRELCKVPLCRQFKVRASGEGEEKKKGDDATWRSLVRKVILARVMSSMAARKTPEQLIKAWERCRSRKN
ncbi:BTB/POZ and TAZ domain-containing protein 1-like [Phalaenopsis equestris]|uniref:BTB/POZ and TAZ domain-containing protein 1-like n=1 Tax=Phalaenopsis equestris TaxID=78828 RepID=UPI0009E5F980|nr:BTB/POZ and TAZ domain-containing protein 1-like [Phalaenopsis equestris]